jgi:O-antigen/teichoic acid export membrane protein
MSLKGASWDSFFLTFVKIVTTFTAIIQTKILATGLSLTEYGTYSQANVIVSIGASLLLLGFGDSINYFYNNKTVNTTEKERISFVNTIYFLEFVFGIIFALIMVLGRSFFSTYFNNVALKAVIIIVAIKPMLDNMISFYQILYVSTGKAKIIAVRNFVVTVLRIALMYISVYVFKNIIWIFWSLILLDVLQLLFFEIWFIKDGFLVNPFKVSFNKIKPILAYGLPMGVFALTNQLTRDIDKLVIGRFADTDTMAVYTNCSKILPFDIIVLSFATVLIPYITRYISAQKNTETVKLFSNYIKIGYYSVWILGTAVLITAEQVIAFLYSDAYTVGKDIFVIYILDSMLKFASMHLILTSSGKSKQLMLFSIITLILNFVLNIILFQLLGNIGPAIATLLVTAIYIIMVLNSSLKTIKAKWKDIFEIKDVLPFVFKLVVFAVIFYAVNRVLLHVDVNKYIAMFISAGGFCIVNLILNIKKIKTILKEVNTLKLK